MSSLYETFMLPTLPNYLSCHIHRCFDGLHDAVWYYLDYIRVLQMYCPIVYFSMNLLQTYTCLCIDNRCVDKRKRYAFYKITMHRLTVRIKLISSYLNWAVGWVN